jgi:hypothetical protein
MEWGSKKETEKTKEESTEQKPQFSADELLAKMSELLAPLATSLNETKTRLAAMEEANRKPEPAVEPSSILDDEAKWKNENLTPLAIATINTNARISLNEILNEVRSEGWGEFAPEIKKAAENAPIQIKANGYDEYVRNIVDMVIGRESRKNGLKRRNSSFILEDASASNSSHENDQVAQADREFLNFEVVTSKGKHVRRGEFLERMGIDVHNPETLKKVKEQWSKVQVVN